MSQSAMYGLKHQARCIESLLACDDSHQFLIGTMSPREDNELHLIEFDEDTNEINLKQCYTHSIGEIWDLKPCPNDTNLVFTSFCDSKQYGTALWRMSSEDNSVNGSLEEVLRVQTAEGSPARVIWNPIEGYNDSIMVLDHNNIRHYKLEESNTVLTDEDGTLLSADISGPSVGSWDPHHSNQFVSATNTTIEVWDVRTNSSTQRILQAHQNSITDIDYNPNKPYHILTGGKDRCINIWDLRHASKPLKKLHNHTNWVCSVKYNRFHDQLVLSAGADTTVNLWKVLSISSAPLGDLEDAQNEKDRLVKSYDEHDDSVYAVAWSSYDAWIFASLSYDGRVVVNHVPKAEKYKILL